MRLGGAAPAYILPQMRQATPLEGDIPDGRVRQLEVHRGRCYAHSARYPYPLGAPYAPPRIVYIIGRRSRNNQRRDTSDARGLRPYR